MREIDHFYVLEQEEYEDGDLILREGSPTDWVYVILEGQVKVQKNIAGKVVTITSLGKNSFLGEMAFFERGKRGPTSPVFRV